MRDKGSILLSGDRTNGLHGPLTNHHSSTIAHSTID